MTLYGLMTYELKRQVICSDIPTPMVMQKNKKQKTKQENCEIHSHLKQRRTQNYWAIAILKSDTSVQVTPC